YIRYAVYPGSPLSHTWVTSRNSVLKNNDAENSVVDLTRDRIDGALAPLSLHRMDQKRAAVVRRPREVLDRLLPRQDRGGIRLLDTNGVHAQASSVLDLGASAKHSR